MNILPFPGSIALSDFRREALVTRCQEVDAALRDLQVSFFYVAKLKRNLTDQEHKRLESLINIGEVSPTATNQTYEKKNSIRGRAETNSHCPTPRHHLTLV